MMLWIFECLLLDEGAVDNLGCWSRVLPIKEKAELCGGEGGRRIDDEVSGFKRSVNGRE
jgi:hypothetical protein